ncbi:MAG: hypothetical protein KAK04_16805, partial [Cyclobacteriaceae bacterium]|nr:hypothetical protein [Cyclobacteriaceae bacterium]
KKTKQVADLELSSDYEIIIYLRFDNQSIINKDDFNLILEEYKALENHYVIGKINFSKLVGSKWLSNPNINIILMENSNENHG